jgi:hypothetical protein
MARDIITNPPRYKVRFTAAARAYTPTEDERQEVRASLDRLKGLLPLDIDPAQHPTLLYIVGNLAVAGVANLNDDAVSITDGLRIYKGFEWQQINLEHNRGEVRGFVVKAGLSELGTDRIITEDEAREANKPFNIAIVVALWKVTDKDLVRYILQSNAPGSPTKDDLSFSFEVGFDDYSVIVLPRGTSNLDLVTQTIASSSADFPKWDKVLRVNKGSGSTKGGDRVARVLVGDILPLGGGIVTVPAAAVKGLVPITEVPVDEPAQDDTVVANTAKTYDYSSTQCTLCAKDAQPFLEYAASIPDEHLYTEVEGYGRENEPHVTALYGIIGSDSTALHKALVGCGPVSLTLGKVSAFQHEEKPYEVLTVDVASDDLHRLHALIQQSCECKVSWPDYRPHLTIAYLRKGLAAGYIGDARFEGKRYTFPSLTFSPHTGPRVEIPLFTPPPAQTAPEQVYSTVDTPATPEASPDSPPTPSPDAITSKIAYNEASQACIEAGQALVKASDLLVPFITNRSSVSVSTIIPLSMTLDELNTLQASVQTSDKIEDLKTAFANVALFAAEIAKASEEMAKAKKTAEESLAVSNASIVEIKAQLDTLTQQHNEMVAAQAAAAAEQAYQERMASVAEAFEFDDETRAEIIPEIKACADDAAFAKWMARAKKLYKGWAKAEKAPPFVKKEEEEDDEEECAKAAAIAKASQEALASAAAHVTDAALPNALDLDPAKNQSLKEKLMAVASKNIRVGGKTLETISQETAAAQRKQ